MVGPRVEACLYHYLHFVYLSSLVLNIILRFMFFFFFSSRRRHTRFDCDWSSDVCSSDREVHVGLRQRKAAGAVGEARRRRRRAHVDHRDAAETEMKEKKARVEDA